MDSAHDTALDRSILVKSISHRSKTVCCARCSWNDCIVSCKCLLVYWVNDSLEVVTSRSWDNYLLSTSIEVSLALSLWCIEACALENYVYTKLAPRTILSVLFCINLKSLAVNSDSISLIVCWYCVKVLTDLTTVTALSCIILKKISEHWRLCQVVDCNYLVALCAKHLSECKTSNTSKTINCDFNCHN